MICMYESWSHFYWVLTFVLSWRMDHSKILKAPILNVESIENTENLIGWVQNVSRSSSCFWDTTMYWSELESAANSLTKVLSFIWAQRCVIWSDCEEAFVDDLILYICCKCLGSDEAEVVYKEPSVSSTSFLNSRRGFVSLPGCIRSNTHGSVLKNGRDDPFVFLCESITISYSTLPVCKYCTTAYLHLLLFLEMTVNIIRWNETPRSL